MTVGDAFLQVLRIIVAMVAILFAVNHPPSFSSGCYESPRGEEYCPGVEEWAAQANYFDDLTK